MSFMDIEESRAEGEPIELFFFKYGENSDAYYAYTDSEEEIIHDGVTYRPIPIDRANVTASGTLDKQMLQIVTPKTSDAAELFRVYPPGVPVVVIIRQGHRGSDEFLVVWSGRVLSCSREGYEAKFSCEPVQTAMRRTGLRRNYQYGCPHVLYGPQCRANKAAATRAVQLAEVYATAIKIGDGQISSAEAPHFTNGMIEWNDAAGKQSRMVLEVANETTFVVAGTTRGLIPGQTVDLILGCAHDMNHCLNIHQNINNYGGQPWIPFKSPVGINPHW